MKKYSKYISIFLVILVVLPGLSQVVSANGQIKTIRLAGNDRSLTSIEVSKEAYKGGASSVVLAGYKGSADALTGNRVATIKDAPLLILAKSGLTKEIKTEIQRLGAKDVYILGGYASIPKEVENELKGLGLTVERIAGDNRYETAVKIAKISTTHKAAYLALGKGAIRADGSEDSLADALAIAPLATKFNVPVLLTKTNELPKETKEALKDMEMSVIIIVGGPMAVSDSVKKEMEKMGITVQRIEGNNRYETAVKIAEDFKQPPTNLILANGIKDADALVGGYLGYKKNAPVLLTRKDALPPETKDYMKKNQLTTYILGGLGVISEGIISNESFDLGVVVSKGKQIQPGIANNLPVVASLDNQNIKYMAEEAGLAGNDINITIVNLGLSKPFSIGLSGKSIVISLATNIFGQSRTTVKDVVQGLNGNSNVKKIMHAQYEVIHADDIVNPMSKTYLKGGLTFVVGQTQQEQIVVSTASKVEAETYELSVTIDSVTIRKDITVKDNDTANLIAKKIANEFLTAFKDWEVVAKDSNVLFMAKTQANDKEFKMLWKIK